MLLVENIGRGAIADAIYTIDSIENIGRRAIRLNEALQNGLLTESRQQLLMEDLDNAMKNLQSSSQSSLSKLDDAIEYVDNFLDIGSKGGDTPIWELVDKSFQVAKDILNELTTIDLGFTGNIKAFFNEGGKLAAIMDALAAEMNILAVYVKVLSAGFAQLIRQMKAMPDEYKDGFSDPDNESDSIEKGDKGKTLKDYVENEEVKKAGGKISAKEFQKGLEDVMNDIQTKNGGYTIWSMKGIKNWFGDNKGKMGLAALGGGVAAIAALATGGLAIGPLAAMAGTVAGGAAAAGGTVGLGSAVVGNMKRSVKNAAGSYKTSISNIAEAMMNSQVNKLEALIPAFVQAVKGTNPAEFAKAAEEAKKTLQVISDEIDAEDLIKQEIEQNNAGELEALNTIDPSTTQRILVQTIGAGKEGIEKYKDTTIYQNLVNIQGALTESRMNDKEDDLILEENEMAHDYTMVDLLFEKKRRKKKKKKSKSVKSTKKASSTKKSTKTGQDKKKSSGVTKPEYKKFKSKMSAAGEKNLEKAERKPSSADKYAKIVDKYEDKVNKRLTNPDRKRNITKIADEFEKKIMALEDEKDTGRDSVDAEEKEDAAEEKGSGALEMLGLTDKPEVKDAKKKIDQIAKDLENKLNATLSESLILERNPSPFMKGMADAIDQKWDQNSIKAVKDATEELASNPKDGAAQEKVKEKLKELEIPTETVEEEIEAVQQALTDAEEVVIQADLPEEDKKGVESYFTNIIPEKMKDVLNRVMDKYGKKEEEKKEEDSAESDVELGSFSDLFSDGSAIAKYKPQAGKQMTSKAVDYLKVLLGSEKFEEFQKSTANTQTIPESYDRRFLKLAGIL